MQNVNLLDALPAHKKKYLVIERFVWGLAGWILLLLLIYVISLWSLVSKRAELSKLEAQKMALQQRIETVTSAAAKLKEQLKDTPQAAVADISGMPPKLAKVLRGEVEKGFGKYMLALGEAVPEHLWLQQFTFDRTNSFINLTGCAKHSRLIADLLQNLRKSSAFSEDEFAALNVKKIATGKYKGAVDFTLSTQVGKKQ